MVAHLNIQDAAVIRKPDDEAGEVPVAFVVTIDPAPNATQTKDYIVGTLAHYKQIHKVYFVDEIPKPPPGKILCRLLRQRLTKL